MRHEEKQQPFETVGIWPTRHQRRLAGCQVPDSAPPAEIPGELEELSVSPEELRAQADEAVRRLRLEQASRRASEAAERRARFLASASRSLLDVHTVDPAVRRIAEPAVPALGTYAALHLVLPDGTTRTAEDLEHVFETFWRGSRSAGRWAAGIGLGLSIARELVDELHGEISVRSQIGEGTEFRIRLPAGDGDGVPITVDAPARS